MGLFLDDVGFFVALWQLLGSLWHLLCFSSFLFACCRRLAMSFTALIRFLVANVGFLMAAIGFFLALMYPDVCVYGALQHVYLLFAQIWRLFNCASKLLNAVQLSLGSLGLRYL